MRHGVLPFVHDAVDDVAQKRQFVVPELAVAYIVFAQPCNARVRNTDRCR